MIRYGEIVRRVFVTRYGLISKVILLIAGYNMTSKRRLHGKSLWEQTLRENRWDFIYVPVIFLHSDTANLRPGKQCKYCTCLIGAHFWHGFSINYGVDKWLQHGFLWDTTSHPCPHVNGGWSHDMELKSRYGGIIVSSCLVVCDYLP